MNKSFFIIRINAEGFLYTTPVESIDTQAPEECIGMVSEHENGQSFIILCLDKSGYISIGDCQFDRHIKVTANNKFHIIGIQGGDKFDEHILGIAGFSHIESALCILNSIVASPSIEIFKNTIWPAIIKSQFNECDTKHYLDVFSDFQRKLPYKIKRLDSIVQSVMNKIRRMSNSNEDQF